MPDHQGPWSFPPAPPPPAPAPRRRVATGLLLIWLGLLAIVGAAFWALTEFFPGQLSGMDQVGAMQSLGLLALISSGLVFARRSSLGTVARNAAIWIGLGAAILVGYSFRGEAVSAFERVRGELIPAYAVASTPRSLTLTAADDGHFYVMGLVNGAQVKFVIDTGASGIVLAPADAQRAGVDAAALKFDAPAETANGVGYGAPYTAPSLAVGQLRLTSVAMEVNQTPISASLLGMSFLKRLDSFQVKGDQMILTWKPAA